MVYAGVREIMRSVCKTLQGLDEEVFDVVAEAAFDQTDELTPDAAIGFLNDIRDSFNKALDKHIVGLREVVVEEDNVASQSI